MRNRFDQQLTKLNNELIEMGSMIEKAIENAVKAMVTSDIELARTVIRSDEEIDHQEKTIENLCLKLLLQQQPVASDLRQISSALKMITDMERIGDQAADISEIVISMASEKKSVSLDMTLLEQMAKETTLMLVGSIDAFVNKNQTQAEEVIGHDDTVDDLFNRVRKELVEKISTDKACGEQAADMLMVAKYFERIGDHATNISEWVIYSITGSHID